MKNNHAVLPFVMSGLAFVCFLLAAILMSTAVQPLWGQTLLLLLPAAVLCAIGFFARGGILSSRVTEVLTAVLSVLFLLLSLGYVFFLSLRAATTVTTDTKFYERAYDRIDGNESISACFPPHVPEDAQEVDFCYRPQFLQGGEVFRLSYRTTEDRLIERIGQLQAAAEWSGSDEAWHELHRQSAGDPDLIRFQLFGKGFSNHGEEGCVLIDRADCRMTFYYSRW